MVSIRQTKPVMGQGIIGAGPEDKYHTSLKKINVRGRQEEHKCIFFSLPKWLDN